MTIQGIQIDGQGTFNDVTENAGVVSTAVFAGSASNSGTVSLSAEFGDDSANHGEVTQVAVFAGNAVNTGTVAVAEFRDTAMNAGTVSTSATFAGTSVNTGTVATAFFTDSAANDGGTVTGNAVFADTSVNSGTVQGDAEVAATATNSGTVGGNVSEYVPPNGNPSAGTVLQSGVTTYITIDSNQVSNGTHDVIADGNGGSTDGNFNYPSSDTELYTDGSTYHYLADGSGGYIQYYISGVTISSGNANYTTIIEHNGGVSVSNGTYDVKAANGNGSTFNDYNYPSAGTELLNDGYVYHYLANGSGGYSQYYISGYKISENNANYITINGSNYSNGSYNVVADGNGGSYNDYSYPAQGAVTFIGGIQSTTNHGSTTAVLATYDIVSDGNGGYTNANYNYPTAGTIFWNNDDGTSTYADGSGGMYTA